MDITNQAMRILAALTIAKGGEIKVHLSALQNIGPETHLECTQDGPLVVVRVRINEKKVGS